MKKTYIIPESTVVELNVSSDIMDNMLGNSNGATFGGGATDPNIQGGKSTVWEDDETEEETIWGIK